MFDELRKIPVFIIRDFRILFTYKIAFSTSFLNIIFNLFYFVIFGSMFGSNEINHLIPYGGNFISYLLIGSIGWGFIWSVMSSTSSSLLNEMYMGTLESLLTTPTKMLTIIFSYSIYGSIWGLLSLLILMTVGFFVFGIGVFATASISTIIIFLLSLTMMMGFGMIFGGLTLMVKRIGASVSLVQNISMIFCGVYFPISVLPAYFQPIAKFIPFYYPIEGLRISLLPESQFGDILYYILMLIFLSIISILVGLFILHKGLMKAKKEGSLTYY